jgi:glycerophosphoryl diester phosphodiesterase
VPTAQPARRPAISAHRAGAQGDAQVTYAAVRSAIATGAEYVEFDVRRTRDGELVVYHRPTGPHHRPVAALTRAELCRIAGYRVPLVVEVMHMLAGAAAGHLDLKTGGAAAAAAEAGLKVLGPDGFLITTGDDAVAATLKRTFPSVRVGLTVGGEAAGAAGLWLAPPAAAARIVADRAGRCGADWVVIEHRLARGQVLRECRRRGLRTMIWTVSRDRALRRALADPLVDVLVTDRPALAVTMRRGGSLSTPR